MRVFEDLPNLGDLCARHEVLGMYGGCGYVVGVADSLCRQGIHVLVLCCEGLHEPL